MNDLLEQLAVEKAATLALQTSYDDEKLLRLKAEGSLQELRRIHESLACSSEISEEFIVNKLIIKIKKAKEDREKMVLDLESEEECFTNSLQRKLRSLKLEKEEAESEVGELKKQLDKMRVEQEKIARDVEAEQELISNNLFKTLHKTLHEKSELESQICRSNSGRNSTCSSINSSISAAGRSDSPISLQRTGSFPNEVSLLLSYKKMSDSSLFSPRKRAPISPGTSSNNSENIFP